MPRSSFCKCSMGYRPFSSCARAVQAPKASENFRCLCTGEKGVGKASKKVLHYKASSPPANAYPALVTDVQEP